LVGRDEDGKVERVTPSGSSSPVVLGPVDSRLVVGGEVLSIGSRYVAPTIAGFAAFSPGGTTVEYEFPQVDCQVGSGVYTGSAPETTTPHKCGQAAVALAADSAGGVWYMGSGPRAPVGYIVP
jgi:hypothetical protein